uniref:Uncharacterized protein n=2 Tax=Picea TaxID=3328 RepID=A0A117NIR3_PICGL|nr:hypothetical protein ABT39_MTgene128 [Picea glauca]QHR91772.1 hypothetical protein Q903MT_gene5808 [Picea sitchensis]
MNRRVDGFDPLQLLRGDTDSTRSMGTTLGHHSMSGIRGGDILDVTTPVLTRSITRYIEEITNESGVVRCFIEIENPLWLVLIMLARTRSNSGLAYG